MSNGLRQKPQGSTKDKFRAFEAELKNMQMAGRISQMMVQQLVQNNKGVGEDMGKLFQLTNEMQYKFLALQEVLGVDVAKLNEVTSRLRLKDFNEASDKEDLEQGFTTVDVVEQDSTVILTSTTQETDRGIFRSRVKLADTGTPELIQGLMGKGVGTKVKVKLNNVEHEIELLGIRRPKPEVAAEPLKAVEAAEVH